MMKKLELNKLYSHNPSVKRGIWRKIYLQRHLLLMTIPFIVVAFIFSYVPLWGWLLAFVDYKVGHDILGSAFIGLKHFKTLFADAQFYNVLRNTLVMGLLSLFSGFVGSIALALLLNEIRLKMFKRIIQTITYIPHFVSWVVIANILTSFLSPDGGIINRILLDLGLVNEAVYFMSKENWFWGIHTMAGLWKELGWSTIIYLAVLAGINPDLYEAADVDGASRYRKMWHISIPGIMPKLVVI